jgi:hypothetical protein
MKLSENTLSILKNFAAINSGIVLHIGNVQKTISPEKSILVEAELDESIPNSFGIYDLNQFLGNVSTLDNPDLTFDAIKVVINDGELSLNYFGSSPSTIISPPEKALVMKSVDVQFVLTNANLQKLLKIAALNSLPNITVIGKSDGIYLQTHEKANDTSNFASIKIVDTQSKDFTVSFKTENLKLIPDDYDVEIQIDGFAKLTAKNKKLKYFIALETK